MPVNIPDEILATAQITELDLSNLAGMSQREFRRLLADRRISIHSGVEEF